MATEDNDIVSVEYLEINGYRVLHLLNTDVCDASERCGCSSYKIIDMVLEKYGFVFNKSNITDNSGRCVGSKIEWWELFDNMTASKKISFKQNIDLRFYKFKTNWKPEWQRRKDLLLMRFGQ